MQDTELYQQILGLKAPWRVGRIELKVKEERVDLWIEYGEGSKFPCPECGQASPIRDHRDRVWRHLDSCQFATYVHCEVPRVECGAHGVRQVTVPWSEPGSQFTALLERLAIDLRRECSVQGAARILGISWDEAFGIQKRAVARGLAQKKTQPLRQLGIDETAARRGHHYLTVVADLERKQVEFVTEDRKLESIDRFYQTRPPESWEQVEAIAMDMWEPYYTSTLTHVPGAAEKIVFDRFHVMQHLGEAVDRVRRQEHGQFLKGEGESPLSKTKYLWLFSRENIPDERFEDFHSLLRKKLKVARAWMLKEMLREMWKYRYAANARRFFEEWYASAIHGRLGPIKKVARMLRAHLKNIVTYAKHRITNAVTEGINAKIQAIKKTACGFRNMEHFKIAIYFHCGGLDLYAH
ncbi:MAG: ISL3 family transposase [Terriglobia bacterium]